MAQYMTPRQTSPVATLQLESEFFEAIACFSNGGYARKATPDLFELGLAHERTKMLSPEHLKPSCMSTLMTIIVIMMSVRNCCQWWLSTTCSIHLGNGATG